MNYIDDYIAALPQRSCGPDLEYAPAFIELEQLVKCTDTVQYGEHIYAPEPVDWGRVEKLCQGLHEQTLDLRVSVLLTRALLERLGLSGFIGGLRLVSWLLHQRWESVHPQLVATDQFDPLIRINTLAELAVPSTIVAALKREVLAAAHDGQVLYLAGLDSLGGVEGAAQTECQDLLAKLIEPHCSPELMRSLSLINSLHVLLDEIALCLEEKSAIHGISPLQGLSHSVHKWARSVEDRLRVVAPKSPKVTSKEYRGAASMPGVNDGWRNGCKSRADVVQALEAICTYYQQQEPSSPVPFLIARIRRLTDMSFIEIIAELAPEAVSDLRRLGVSVND